MSNLIRKFNELKTPTTLKAMIYGSAGSGKTTLALGSPRPLLLDFDNGVYRVNIEHIKDVATVQVGSWADVLSVLNEDLSDFDTIVIDTVGKMMDFIITHKCGQRQPQIKDWGGINQEFSTFVRNLSLLNKHIIFIAHRDTRKEGDDTIYVPVLREKNYAHIITELDLLGYFEMKTESGVTKRSITFDPTPRNDGKNTCNLPSVMFIPENIDKKGNITRVNNFFSESIIRPYMSMIAVKKAEVDKYEAVMEMIRAQVDRVTNADEANEFIALVPTLDHIGSSLTMARALITEKAKALGLVFNKEAKVYEEPKREPQPSLL